MPKITLDQFCDQWVPREPTKVKPIPKRLETLIEDFITEAGVYAKDCFQSSFEKGGFCGHTTWEPYSARWAKRLGDQQHPVLLDYGNLKNGIIGGLTKDTPSKWSWPSTGKGRFGKERGFRRNYFYRIRTTEIAVPEYRLPIREGQDGTSKRKTLIKRGRVNRDKYNYAAIHNTPANISPFTVNQYSDRKPVQRQFIGHDQSVLDHINYVILPNKLDQILYFYYA